MRARIYGRNETSKHHRFTVKALFEGSVYWLLNIDILLSGLRKEARCPPRIHLFNHTLHSFPPLFLSLSLARSLRTHTYRHIPARAYNTYLPRAYWRFLSFWKRAAASRVFVTRINKIFEIVQHIRQFFTREERGRFSGCQGIAGRKSEGWNLLDGMKRKERIGIKKRNKKRMVEIYTRHVRPRW